MGIATNLVAMSLSHGRYAVISQTTAKINEASVRDAGLLHDVSEDRYCLDEAAVIHKSHFQKFLFPETDHRPALEWLSSLPAEATFILVHLAEWESGLD